MMVTRRLKDLGTFKTGLTYSPDNLCEENNGVLVLRSSNIKEGKLSFIDNVYVDLSLSNKMLVKKGDIIICSRNGSANLVGKTAVIDSDIVASWGAFMMLFRTKHNSRYLNYLLNVYITKNKGLFATSTINQLTNSMLGNIYVDFVENINEQDKIADYLDEKTKAIDTRISMLEKKSEAYKRLKASVINRAVTRGLNPDVTVRDSGIEWIGMIPEHWNPIRLKDVSYLYSGLTGKAGDDFRCDDESLTKPYLPFTNVLNNTKIDFNQVNRVVMGENENQNRVNQNDLIFLMSSEDYESIAKSAVVEGDPGELYLNSFCRGLHFTSRNVQASFVNYQLNSKKYRDALRFEARGFTRINIKIDRIASQFVTLPPLDEQQQIVDYLDAKCTEIDKAIDNIGKQIDALKRLKRSLINEVVTGKRKV